MQLSKLIFISVIILFVWFTSVASAQNNASELEASEPELIGNDSVKGAKYYELARKVLNENSELALAYADTGYTYFVALGIEEKIAEKKYIDAVILYAQGELAKAQRLMEEHYEWSIANKNELRKAFALNMLTKLSRESGDLSSAIAYAVEGIEYSRQMEYLRDEGFYTTELGNIYTVLEQWDISKDYFEQAYEVSKKINHPIAKAISLRNLAENALMREDYNLTKEYLSMSLTLDSTSNYSIGLSRSYRNLGLMFDKTKQYEKALLQYNKALNLLENDDSSTDLVYIHQGLAKVLMSLNQYDEAMEHLKVSAEYAVISNALNIEVDQSLLESKYFEHTGQYKKALQKAISHRKANKKLLDDKISNQITGLSIRYETNQKEQEIVLLNAKNEIIARRNLYLAIGLGGLGFLAFVLFRLYKTIQSKNTIIEKALEEKDVLLREIHHRVKNNLQFVSSLLNLQSRSLVDSSAQSALQEGQNRVKSMALIHQNLYQEGNLTGVEIKEYFEKLSTSLFDSYNISPDRISLQLDIENVNLDVDTVVPLGLVVNELISNSLKHAFVEGGNGVVEVSLKENNDVLELIVSDNGKGLNADTEQILKKSFGYRLVTSFSSQLDADLFLSSESGTTVRMLIKDYTKVA